MGREEEVIRRCMVVELSSTKMTFQRSENANRNLMKASNRAEERRSVYTQQPSSCLFILELQLFSICLCTAFPSAEVKRVYRFLLHIYPSNLLRHTDYIFLSTSDKQGDTGRQK